jgi:hypothetical protein
MCALGLELIFIRINLMKQSQKLPGVNEFFAGNVLEYFDGELVVC